MLASLFARQKDGRLGLSPTAMKLVAKDLATRDPLPAVMAGLRADRAHMPFEVLEEPVKDLTIIGCPGSGFRDVASAYMHAAARSGFRIIALHSDYNLIFQGHSPEDLREIVWSAGATEGVFVRKELRSQARVLNLQEGSMGVSASKEATATFLNDAMDEPSVRQILVRLPVRAKAALEDYVALLAQCLDVLRNRRTDLSDCVVFLEEADVSDGDGAFLRRSAGGVLRVSTPQMARSHARPDDLCLFMKSSAAATRDFEPGEALVGRFREEQNARNLPKMMAPYTSDTFYALDPVVLRALNRIAAEPNVSDLPHMARLNLVARAAGYAGWHKVPGAGR